MPSINKNIDINDFSTKHMAEKPRANKFGMEAMLKRESLSRLSIIADDKAIDKRVLVYHKDSMSKVDSSKKRKTKTLQLLETLNKVADKPTMSTAIKKRFSLRKM